LPRRAPDDRDRDRREPTGLVARAPTPLLSRWAVPALAGLGLSIAGYLTWVHYSGGLALCTGAAGCETVQASRFAVVGGVSVALLGFLTYGLLLALALWHPASPRAAELRQLTLFGVALVGTLYSAYLTYLEIFVIGAICPWCVTSALLIAAILALAIHAVLRPTDDEAPGIPTDPVEQPESITT
jgi:uncharacterized membrane protein